MTARYSSRKTIDCKVSIISQGILGHGRVLDLSVPGCLFETGVHLQAGQSLQLKLVFPTGKPLTVTLAIVRWINGAKAGVEFIRMSQEDQALLRGMWALRRNGGRRRHGVNGSCGPVFQGCKYAAAKF
jgi:hypothetical protein